MNHVACVVMVALCLLTGCGGGGTQVEETFVLEMTVFVNGRPSNAVLLAVRTNPSAEQLSLSDLELVGSDGKAMAPTSLDDPSKPVAQEIGKQHWILFALPRATFEAGGLKLRTKSTGNTAPLPSKIETIAPNVLDERGK